MPRRVYGADVTWDVHTEVDDRGVAILGEFRMYGTNELCLLGTRSSKIVSKICTAAMNVHERFDRRAPARIIRPGDLSDVGHALARELGEEARVDLISRTMYARWTYIAAFPGRDQVGETLFNCMMREGVFRVWWGPNHRTKELEPSVVIDKSALDSWGAARLLQLHEDSET